MKLSDIASILLLIILFFVCIILLIYMTYMIRYENYFNKFHRDPGLVVGFSFRVREIPGSIPGDPLLLSKKYFC